MKPEYLDTFEVPANDRLTYTWSATALSRIVYFKLVGSDAGDTFLTSIRMGGIENLIAEIHVAAFCDFLRVDLPTLQVNQPLELGFKNTGAKPAKIEVHIMRRTL